MALGVDVTLVLGLCRALCGLERAGLNTKRKVIGASYSFLGIGIRDDTGSLFITFLVNYFFGSFFQGLGRGAVVACVKSGDENAAGFPT